jgi:hypothetical protein
MTAARAAATAGVGLAALVVAAPFFAATTFIGDDHVFLGFARYAAHPFVPFYRDQHGGEYYRPLPMLVWWLLGRAGGGSLPFAALALALHAAAAGLVGALILGLGRPRPVAVAAAALMLLAPQNLEAAYWFAASTDLFATVFVLGSLVALGRGRNLVAALLALAGYLSKESAFVAPLLALVLLPIPWRARLKAIAPQIGLAVAVLVARRLVLGGGGGSGDTRAGALAKTLQIASGLAHIFTGTTLLPEVLAFGLGTAVLALGVFAATRRREARWSPFVLTSLAILPLVAAGWVVGARYFYLPAVGIAWAAAEALAGASPGTRIAVAATLLCIGLGQAAQRRQDVVSYDLRVAAARRAVAAGFAEGHRVFHVDGGIKDLDLAVKEEPRLAPAAREILVLADVPASFAIIPPALEAAASIVVASPPLPPSGAYRFGDVRIVGLARRGDEPSLDEVVASFPDVRFIRLRPTPGGRVVARDLTDEVKRRLDAADDDGQN